MTSCFIRQGAEDEWQKVFYIGAAIYLFGWIMFIIFADAEVQDWAKGRTDHKNETETRISKAKGDPIYSADVATLGYKDLGMWNQELEVNVKNYI